MYEFLSRYELPRNIGSQGEYSNLGMGLLGHVLARAAGGTYEEVVRERILEPLGMRRTGIELEDEMRELMLTGVQSPGWLDEPNAGLLIYPNHFCNVGASKRRRRSEPGYSGASSLTRAQSSPRALVALGLARPWKRTVSLLLR